MNRETILGLIDGINVWKRGSVRAPNKPLLLLYALGKIAREETGPIRFEEAAPVLTELLREFGPSRMNHHPEYPFWRLANDGLWLLEAEGPLSMEETGHDPSARELVDKKARGRLPDAVAESLRSDPKLLNEVAERLLDGHFPRSLHEDIASMIGLSLGYSEAYRRRRRDPRFRDKILTAYEHRCAVCGLDIRIGAATLAIEAVHIKWHQAGGPDTERNGLALCALHHKVFDLGAFTLNEDHCILVSERVTGSTGFHYTLLR
ncbi:MAG TPA: HNH endonuclease, partial [Acidobacteriota bacterium]|nr:HNH endonuclease [Acidobacteriota bacterium]